MTAEKRSWVTKVGNTGMSGQFPAVQGHWCVNLWFKEEKERGRENLKFAIQCTKRQTLARYVLTLPFTIIAAYSVARSCPMDAGW